MANSFFPYEEDTVPVQAGGVRSLTHTALAAVVRDFFFWLPGLQLSKLNEELLLFLLRDLRRGAKLNITAAQLFRGCEISYMPLSGWKYQPDASLEALLQTQGRHLTAIDLSRSLSIDNEAVLSLMRVLSPFNILHTLSLDYCECDLTVIASMPKSLRQLSMICLQSATGKAYDPKQKRPFIYYDSMYTVICIYMIYSAVR